jgi:hypothetical protein
MAIEEVTMYRMVCDTCGKSAQEGDYWAWAQPEGAIEEASESGWEFFDVEPEHHYCPDCIEWDDELDGFKPTKPQASSTTGAPE